MKLPEAEQLVRKLDELIGQPGLESQAPRFATEYTELARAASSRLDQCAQMIERGSELEALELAEAPPALLDLVTVLNFRQAKEWRGYCQKSNLPWVEAFNEKHLRSLNSIYAAGIASDHPYYKDYRRAILQGDERRALSILKIIHRLNPADKNAAQELIRLQEKAGKVALEELRQALESGDTAATLGKLSAIERSGLAIPRHDTVWLQAQGILCHDMLGKVQGLRVNDAWEDASSLLEEIRGLATREAVPFSAPDGQLFHELLDWVAERQDRHAKEQDFQHAQTAFKYRLETCENLLANVRNPSPAKMEEELNLLLQAWDEAERFGQALDAQLIGRADAACTALRQRVDELLRRRKLAKLAGSVAGVALIAVAVLAVWLFVRQKELVSRLQELQSTRRVTQTAILLQSLPKMVLLSVTTGPGLQTAEMKAQRFVAQEQALTNNFYQKLAELKSSAGRGFDNYQSRGFDPLAGCVQAEDQIAPEFKPKADAELQQMGQLWQDHLAALRPQFNRDFESGLTNAEAYAKEHLTLNRGFEAIRSGLPRAWDSLASLDVLRTSQVTLDPNLISRYDALRNELTNWDRATKDLLAAQKGDDFKEALQELSRSSFLDLAQLGDIQTALNLKDGPSELLGMLLQPDHPEMWDSLTNLQNQSAFKPDQPSDPERDAWLNLCDDANLHDVYAYSLHPNTTSHPNNPFQPHNVFVQNQLGKDRFENNDPSGKIYDPTRHRDGLYFEQQTLKDFDYSSVELNGMTHESALYNQLRLGQLIDADRNVTRSILELLDELSQAQDSSAMYRAYISLKLYDIAQMRPAEWGLIWAPGAALHIERLRELRAAEIQSGDWLVPGKYPVYEAALENYFSQAQQTPLAKQAEFFELLARRAADAGFSFAGFVDANGKLSQSAVDSPGLELWGWSRVGNRPSLLLQRARTDQPWQNVSGQEPLPFTPLFLFGSDRGRMLAGVSERTLYPVSTVKSLLPPLFSGL